MKFKPGICPVPLGCLPLPAVLFEQEFFLLYISMISRGRNLKCQHGSENVFLLTGLPPPPFCFDAPSCRLSSLALQPGCFISFPQDAPSYQVHLQVCKNFFLSPQLDQGDFILFFFFPLSWEDQRCIESGCGFILVKQSSRLSVCCPKCGC